MFGALLLPCALAGKLTMENLAALLAASAAYHNHLCPRQVLGVRMGMLAAALLALDLPRSDKRLLTLVETDGCFADGIAAATGCTMGHRTLRLFDYGKVAATFVDTRNGQAIRIAPHAHARAAAAALFPNARSRWHAQLEAYQLLPDDELLAAQPVRLAFSLEQMLSRPGLRVVCDGCGEEIMNERELHRAGMTLCRTCAGEGYYELPGPLFAPCPEWRIAAADESAA